MLSSEPPQVRKRWIRPLARASFPKFRSPPFADCQPRYAKSIVRGSQYGAQQILRTAVLLGRLCKCFYLSDSFPPEDAV